MAESQSVATFRAASSKCQEELLAVLQRHRDALDGPMGQVIALTELLGSVLHGGD